MDTVSAVALAHSIQPLAACCSFSPLLLPLQDQTLDFLPKSITKSKGLEICTGNVGYIFPFFLRVDLHASLQTGTKIWIKFCFHVTASPE